MPPLRKEMQRGALKVLSQMLTHGEDSVRIISLLAWQIKRLWRAKQILKQGGDEHKVSTELQVVPFFCKNVSLSRSNCILKRSHEKHALLLETDVKSKTSSFGTQLLVGITGVQIQ